VTPWPSTKTGCSGKQAGTWVGPLRAPRRQQNALFNEFGGEAQKDWWDPGSDGKGAGKPIGLRGVAQRLEVEAASGGLFAVRFAGGREAILTRMEVVVHKWLTQFLHHTALGLPFAMTAEGIPGQLTDPSATVLFAAVWIFGQQIYLLHDLHGRDTTDFNEVFRKCLVEGFGADPSLIIKKP
jgi:hypothetical protein